MKSLEDILEGFKASIDKKGFKTLQVRTLMSQFSYKKRSRSNVEYIQKTLLQNGYYLSPKLTLKIPMLNDTIRISRSEELILGDLFESEAQLQSYIELNQKYQDLRITNIKREYSPKQTADRFDLCGEDDKGNRVVIELKHKDGAKSAVEQVLRYIGHLKRETDSDKVRGILVTGVRGFETASAIKGMHAAQKKEFEWYLYAYCKEKDTLKFERITPESIDEMLK